MKHHLTEDEFAAMLQPLNRIIPAQRRQTTAPARSVSRRRRAVVITAIVLGIGVPASAISLNNYVDSAGVLWHKATGQNGDTENFAAAPATRADGGLQCSVVGFSPERARTALSAIGETHISWYLSSIDDTVLSQPGFTEPVGQMPTSGVVTSVGRELSGTLRVDVTVLKSGANAAQPSGDICGLPRPPIYFPLKNG